MNRTLAALLVSGSLLALPAVASPAGTTVVKHHKVMKKHHKVMKKHHKVKHVRPAKAHRPVY